MARSASSLTGAPLFVCPDDRAVRYMTTRSKARVLALTALAPRGSGSDLEGFIDDEEGDEQLGDAEVLACLEASRHKPDTELARPRGPWGRPHTRVAARTEGRAGQRANALRGFKRSRCSSQDASPVCMLCFCH